MYLNALLSNSPIFSYLFFLLVRPAALSHFWAKSTVILVMQEQLFLWCKNRYSYGARTVILVIQEPLFLWCKNSYYCDARTVIFMVQEQLLLYHPFFSVEDISWTLLLHIYRSFFALLEKKKKKNRSYGQLWTVMDSYGHLALL